MIGITSVSQARSIVRMLMDASQQKVEAATEARRDAQARLRLAQRECEGLERLLELDDARLEDALHRQGWQVRRSA